LIEFGKHLARSYLIALLYSHLRYRTAEFEAHLTLASRGNATHESLFNLIAGKFCRGERSHRQRLGILKLCRVVASD
jgi:hypothetical protein